MYTYNNNNNNYYYYYYVAITFRIILLISTDMPLYYLLIHADSEPDSDD